jgi:hypothetical protein
MCMCVYLSKIVRFGQVTDQSEQGQFTNQSEKQKIVHGQVTNQSEQQQRIVHGQVSAAAALATAKLQINQSKVNLQINQKSRKLYTVKLRINQSSSSKLCTFKPRTNQSSSKFCTVNSPPPPPSPPPSYKSIRARSSYKSIRAAATALEIRASCESNCARPSCESIRNQSEQQQQQIETERTGSYGYSDNSYSKTIPTSRAIFKC